MKAYPGPALPKTWRAAMNRLTQEVCSSRYFLTAVAACAPEYGRFLCRSGFRGDHLRNRGGADKSSG